MLKSVMLLNIFMKTLIYVIHFLHDLLTNTKFKRTEFIWNLFTYLLLLYSHLDQCNLFFLLKVLVKFTISSHLLTMVNALTNKL